MSAASPWWSPHTHIDRRPFLIERNRIMARMRSFFDEKGFVEVETAALQFSPGNETHLHAFETKAFMPNGTEQKLYLHTSPEFACKRLLSAGERRIVSFAKVFRNRELGALHHPEFTMVEWYRAGENYDSLMSDCADLLALAAETTGMKTFSFRGRSIDPYAAPERLSVAEAFLRYAGIDILATLDSDGQTDAPMLAAALRRANIRYAEDDTWSDMFSRVIVECVEPNLGQGRVTILDEYPTHEAALARPAAHDNRVAERFELYACGVELANAFGELTDAEEQRRRFSQEMAEKKRIYGETYPMDEDFLAAIKIMPAASGIALGFDRLAMLATGASRIDQIIWTPVTETAL